MAKLPTADDMATRGRKGKNNSPWKNGFNGAQKTDAERAEQHASRHYG